MKTLFFLICCCLALPLYAQKDSLNKPDTVWRTGGGVGFDFSSLTLINPRIGAGSNRIGLGGLGNIFANYKQGKVQWTNLASLQLSAQRIGGSDQPYQKNLDVLRGTSRLGFRSTSKKIYYATELDVQTLLLETYENNLLRPRTDERLRARFLSPITVSFSPGLDYTPNKRWSFFYSPVGFKMIYVANDSIAALDVHGNDLGEDGVYQPGENEQINLGSNVRIVYNDTYLGERMAYTSNLNLFSNYLENPQFVDVLWVNNVNLKIFNGLGLEMVYELFFDRDVMVQFDANKNGVFEDGELATRPSHTLAFLLKYNYLFK